jgi:hypothetical protein
MILNIFLTAVIFFVLFFAIVLLVNPHKVSDEMGFVVVGGYLASAATIVITALVLIWTRG